MKHLLLIALLLTLSCSSEPTSNNGVKDESKDVNIGLRRGILEDIGQEVILPTYEGFALKADALLIAAEGWSKDAQSAQAQESAQAAWREAATQWQLAELTQLGPTGLMSEVAAGEDLRYEIYSWPQTNDCRVDIELAAKSYAQPETFATSRINVRGLDALEYLLFYNGDQNACSTQHPLNAEGTWAAIPTQELAQRRADYAKAAAALLVRDAKRLVNAWSPQGDHYLKELTQAGQGSTRYTSTQEAFNAISDAMFYLEKESKDMKLGPPLGLIGCTSDCAITPEKLESRHANASKAHLLANLEAFTLLYQGGPDAQSRGFDDLLRAIGQEALAEAFEADLANAKAALEAIDGELQEALAQDPDAVVAAFDALRAVVTRFRTEFISVLDLELPQRAEGDND